MTNAHENACPDQGATVGGVTGKWGILLWTGCDLWGTNTRLFSFEALLGSDSTFSGFQLAVGLID